MKETVYCNYRDKQSGADVFGEERKDCPVVGYLFQYPVPNGCRYKVTGVLAEREENGKKYISFWVEKVK